MGGALELGTLAWWVGMCLTALCVVYVSFAFIMYYTCVFACLQPCLTIWCLFAAVYIHCTVHGCEADHSREQTVFTESFYILPKDAQSLF